MGEERKEREKEMPTDILIGGDAGKGVECAHILIWRAISPLP